ncbi:MAG TPA: hypothetical protein VHD56_03805 [Tepidisphaeraceae bacterium]|nr:hypothetical protein [Tepidisphaeraceae bacterium]
MSHLEDLLAEYYEWGSHVVKCNTLVGRRQHGGWEMELDIIAYSPENKIPHLEPSLDALCWTKRQERFKKKFNAGRKYIFKDMFPWLPPDTQIIQRAILVSAGEHRRTLAGAEVLSVDEMIGEIKQAVACKGPASRAAISERYPLLRTIQLVVCGHYRLADSNTAKE